MNREEIPDIVVARLPSYLRTIQYLENNGIQTTSSKELSQKIGFSSAQIRKDLSHFGEFGKQGTGYNVHFLIEQLQAILNIEQTWDIAIIGAGDIGHAFSHYQGFKNRSFRVEMIFDNDPEKIGKETGDLVVQDSTCMVEMIQSAGIKIAILSVPESAAQSVADELVKAEIRAILCFAPVLLKLPADIHVEYIDTILNLQHMTYYLKY